MKKLSMVLAAMAVFAFAYMTTVAFGGSMEGAWMPSTQEVSKLIGKDVRNMQGERLGKIKDFVMDEKGHIRYAVLSHGGIIGMGDKLTVVPLSALTYHSDKRDFALDVSKERLAQAPHFKNLTELSNRGYEEQVFTFFGTRPYWEME